MLHCSFKGVWQNILQPVGIDISQAICPHSNCLHSWVSPNTTAYGKCIWPLVPYATWWSIWRTRNDAIFNSMPASIETTIRNIKANLWLWTSMFLERRGYCFGNLMYEIQSGIHDPYEDFVAAVRLYKRMHAQNHPVEEFTTSTVSHSSRYSTIYDSLKPKELDGMCSEDLLKISRPKYRCWCLDSKPNLES
ncbi:hypothetical protein IFM89_000994 [Coptis chinensis]|uniref:Uncharacterized protein n=1 Tax=Coptis chinensis TaxID=261450 RepID=A0A835IJJ7_9MAGN|nr:hypothetical protein IFM89_000994 [Coptis chinensis]